MSKIKNIALCLAVAAVSTVGVSQTAHADSGYAAGLQHGHIWFQILLPGNTPIQALGLCNQVASQQSGQNYKNGFYQGCYAEYVYQTS